MSFLQTFINLVPITLVQGLVYALVAFGVMLPFRILNIPDLSSEGSFPLGGAIAAALITANLHPLLSTFIAACAGFLAGTVTAVIHLKFRVHSLLAGILTITMLWSINLRIMGKPNTPLFGFLTIYDWISPAIIGSLTLQALFFAVLLAIVIAAFWWGLETDAGLGLRGIGANSPLASALGVNVFLYTIVGLGLANALNAAAGALLAQLQGYADIGMGVGMLVNGLAAVIIGEAVTGRRSLLAQLAAPIVGAAVYYQLSSLALSLGLAPSDLKLVTGLFVLATLSWPILIGQRNRAALAG
jgi:putative tryptophan/tyrosine transport system permease protein